MSKDSLEIRISKKHPLWIRWAHWIHFPVLMLMVLSGLQIYWANAAYTRFIDRQIFTYFGLDHALADGMYLHFSLAWIFVLNGVFYFLYLLVSRQWRELIPTRSSFKEAIQVFLHDIGLRKEIPRHGKFNAAQRLAYTSVLFIGVITTISCFAIYKPLQLDWLLQIFVSYEIARFVHFISMIAFIMFFFVHIIQVVRSGWNNFQAMVTGYEVEDESKDQKE